MRKKAIIILVVVVIIAGIAFQLAANKKVIDSHNKVVTHTNVQIPVNIMTVAYRLPDNDLIKSGTLIPYTDADITAVSSGKLVSVNFQLGDIVSAGQILAKVDNSSLQLSLDAAILAKDKAQKDYQRYKVLLAGNATTEMNYQNAKLTYQSDQNKIDQIKRQMADNRIKAPISGQIVSKEKVAGEYVAPGMVLGHIVDVNRLKVDVLVNEQDVYSLHNNAPVTVTTDVYPGVVFNGKIIFISKSGDAVHNYKVEVALKNQKDHPLRAGSFAYVNFHRKSAEKVLLIPKIALIQSLQNPMVYIVKNGKAVQTPITAGQTFGNDIAVLSGLQPGDQIITSGLVNISNGTKVKPISGQTLAVDSVKTSAAE